MWPRGRLFTSGQPIRLRQQIEPVVHKGLSDRVRYLQECPRPPYGRGGAWRQCGNHHDSLTWQLATWIHNSSSGAINVGPHPTIAPDAHGRILGVIGGAPAADHLRQRSMPEIEDVFDCALKLDTELPPQPRAPVLGIVTSAAPPATDADSAAPPHARRATCSARDPVGPLGSTRTGDSPAATIYR